MTRSILLPLVVVLLVGCSAKDGKDGPAGATGAVGPAGATGVMGPIGPAGPTGPAGIAGPTGPAGIQGAPGAPGAAGMAGVAGAPGAAGATGIVSITNFAGGPSTIPGNPGGATPWVFLGTPVTVTTTNTQRITVVANAVLSTSASTANLSYWVCFRPGGMGALFPFPSSGIGSMTATTTPTAASVAQSYLPSLALSWEIGFCGTVFSTNDVNGSLNGYVMVTN